MPQTDTRATGKVGVCMATPVPVLQILLRYCDSIYGQCADGYTANVARTTWEGIHSRR